VKNVILQILLLSVSFVCSSSILAAETNKTFVVTIDHRMPGLDAFIALQKIATFFSKEEDSVYFLSDRQITGFPNVSVLEPTVGNFEKVMDEILTSLEENDRVLINIMAHGLEEKGDTEHAIVLSGGHRLTFEMLKGYIKSLEAKKAQILLVDGSCYSGASIKLSSQNTCVITTSGKNEFGTSEFYYYFWASVDTGIVPESVFLQARKRLVSEIGGSIRPRISAELEQDSFEALRELSDFLRTFSTRTFQNFYEIESSESGETPYFIHFRALEERLLAITNHNDDVKLALSTLRSNFESLYYTALLRKEMNRSIEIEGKTHDFLYLIPLSVVLATNYYDKMREADEQWKNDQAKINEKREMYEIALEKQKMFLSEHPEYAPYYELQKEIVPPREAVARYDAKTLMPLIESERIIFDIVYRILKERNHQNKPSSCSTFQF
jgi:hypothetical protein